MMTAIPSRAASLRIIGNGGCYPDSVDRHRDERVERWPRVGVAAGCGSGARRARGWVDSSWNCRYLMTGDQFVSRTMNYSTSRERGIDPPLATEETR